MRLILIFSIILNIGLLNNLRASNELKAVKKTLVTNYILTDTSKKPTWVLEKTILNPMTIIFISDTSNITGISKVFQSAYAELFGFISQNGLIPGKVMAFYYNYNDPIALESAVEVNKIPAMLSGRIRTRKIEGGDALVIHYTGPYEEMESPYGAINKWLKDNNKQAFGLAFEVYLNDPSMVKDKYELKTDIYQLIK